TWLGKPQHLVSEFENSKDLLSVEYQIKRGSQIIHGTGFCIEASTSKVVLLENGNWNILDSKTELIEKVVPTHTGKFFRFQNLTLIDISADSLNQVIRDQTVAKLEISANQKFQFKAGLQEQETSKYAGEYLNQITFTEIEQEIELEQFVNDDSYLPRIRTLRRKMANLQNEFQLKQTEYEAGRGELNELKTSYQTATNTERELMLPRIRELEKVQPPKLITNRTAELEAQITEIRSAAGIKNEKRRMEMALKNQETLAGVQETRFTGVLTALVVE
ncbi:MAG: hypothetical protein AB8G22_25745, partial [Saprospiraceae bacterium]